MLNLAYYKKLGFSNYKSWSAEDLAEFLAVNNHYRMLWAKDITEERALKDFEIRIKNFEKKKLLLRMPDSLFLKLCKTKKSGKKRILFEESKYLNFIRRTKKDYEIGMLVNGKKDRLAAIKSLTGYIQLNDLEPILLSYAKEKDVKYLYQFIASVEKKLKIFRPDCIVLTYDVFPGERAIILLAEKMGIPTIVVQHSIYSKFNPVPDFLAAKYVLVWGNYFKEEICVKNGRNAEDIYILGYPVKVEKDLAVARKPYKVCYMGQDIQRHNKDLLITKLQNIKDVSRICESLNMQFVYRPHYAESREELAQKMPKIKFTPKGEKLEKTIAKSDIFISFCSTSLVESAMKHKVSLQLMTGNPYIDKYIDNFEELGACARSFHKISELEDYMSQIANARDFDKFRPKFSNNYVETRFDPEERFLEILKDIEKRCEKK